MLISDSNVWEAISSFAGNLGVSEKIITEAKLDFNKLLNRYGEILEISRKYTPEDLNASLSMQKFYPWLGNFLCWFLLSLSGFRHTALRELRFYLEAGARAYYIDSEYGEKSYQDKVNILKFLFQPRKTKEDVDSLQLLSTEIRRKNGVKFKDLLRDLPREKQDELNEFYRELCNYVHLSEQAQTDALSDFGLNIALKHPCYEKDKEMLEKTFEYSIQLLLKSFGEK